MRGVNKVILLGTVGRDPEVRSLGASGSTVTSISLATSEAWKDKNTGQLTEQTEWHRVVFYGRLAEISGEYLRKGSKVYVEGSLRTRKWQDQNGQDKYTTEIVASEMQMLDSRSGDNTGFSEPRAQNTGSSRSGNASGARQQESAPSAGFDQFHDDDIPF